MLPAEVDRLEQVRQECSAGARITRYVGVDLSGSGDGDLIAAERIAALSTIVEQVSVCGGDLHVVAFTGSVAATTVLLDDALDPTGHNDMARIRSVPGVVGPAMDTITAARDQAINSLDRNGSDIIAQYGLAGEYFDQKLSDGKPRVLYLDLLTDGVQTVDVDLNTPELTVAAATELANRVVVEQIPPQTTVTIAGIGRTANTPAPTAYVDAIKEFHLTYCAHSTNSRDNCSVVTDLSR